MANNTSTFAIPVINADQMLEHWQGHRRLTRKVIEAFPENELFSYSLGGMRTFAGLAMEMLRMAAGGVRGFAEGDWNAPFKWYKEEDGGDITTKEDLLKAWDDVTEEMNTYWPGIPAENFVNHIVPFGVEYWGGPGHAILHYFIDNDIHHRGQGYVYLRTLGIEPPGFWDRE
ncbi:DinB family protein [Chitinophaga barathri]|uniref:Damage-inducible protein DinB n=1 Tax=Chitinophaga barathri TaxID=1647451 RepID=A0A3N4MI78_9BACT|nr:DinB family protein [Chitinophaga barathri]RPD41756.1 damage-inducible protein DinB [Chitinophaga barathri]